MPTLDDLRAALDAKAEEAPAPHDVLARVLEGDRRRRWSAPLVAAAAVVVVAGAVVVPVAMSGANHHPSEVAAVSSEPVPSSTPSTHARPAPAPTSAGPQPTSFVYDFTFRDTSKISFEYAGILPGRQLAAVTFGAMAKDAATATVYDQGVFPARVVAGGRPVIVAGHRGYVARFADPLQSLDTTVHLSVAWQYADDSWAVVGANDPSVKSPAQLVAAAQLLRPAQSRLLRIPFKVGYLPPGWCGNRWTPPVTAAKSASPTAAQRIRG